MTVFNPSWAHGSPENRAPTASETDGGFECGEAEKGLFDFIINRIEAQLNGVIEPSGITAIGSNADVTQLRRAIDALIDRKVAASGSTSQDYLTLAAALAHMPIYPEIVTSDGRLNVARIGTSIRVPAGQVILRGLEQNDFVGEDISVAATTIYHLRWSKAGGIELKNTADTTYNPSGLNEADAAFDTTYGDVLLARVSTDSNREATVTNLANKARLSAGTVRVTTGGTVASLTGSVRRVSGLTGVCNFARTPDMVSMNGHLRLEGLTQRQFYTTSDITETNRDRYGVTVSIEDVVDTQNAAVPDSAFSYAVNFNMTAF